MMSTGARWAEIKALFDACIEQPPAEREALIKAAALTPEALVELRSLLVHHDASDDDGKAGDSAGFMASPASAGWLTPGGVGPGSPEGRSGIRSRSGSNDGAVRPGQRLGAWEIVRAVGEGGMGEVFEARRADGQYDGRAAVKLLKRGMDSAAVLRRFAQERQALARLSHPHIARLLDAGANADGLPYFVLEYVDGQSIDAAVRGLALDARLRLFLQLADAVAHAHRNLLVHRDLKPGNVLVDRDGQVKLLDFGIAKALDPLDGHDGATTVGGQRPYTPHYASPEQVRGEPVSTATDIYSLGVLLYQMLTGTRPTGRHATTPAEAARSVLEETPTRPSRLSAREALDPQWISHRKKLEGDLDNILLKALVKQPAERYASVDALAADISAFLEDRPVSARAASPGYVMWKWLGRHRSAAVAAALGALGLFTGLLATLLQGRVALALGATGLAAGLVLALVQAGRAQRALAEAARARDEATRHVVELRRLANSLVFEVNDALEGGLIEGRRQLVRAAAQSLERQAAFDQLGDLERIELGQALLRLARVEGTENTNNLGHVAGALVLYDRALSVLEPLAARQQGLAAWHGATSAALEGRFAVLRQLRRGPEAMSSIERAAGHARRAAALAPQDLNLRCQECVVLVQRADHAYPVVRFHGLCQLDKARLHLAEALQCSLDLAAWASERPTALRVRAYAMRFAAGHLAIEGRLQEAVAAEHQAMAVLQQAIALPGGQPLRTRDFVQALIRVAITQRVAGLYDEAAATLAPALAQAQRDLQDNASDDHRQRQLASVLQTLLDLCLHRDDEAGAQALYAEARSRLPPVLPEHLADPLSKRPWQQAWMDSLQALCWARSGDPARAQELVARLAQWMEQGALRLRNDPAPLDAELEANIHIARTQLAADAGRWDDAAAAADDALDRLRVLPAVRHASDAVEAVRSWQLQVRLARAVAGEEEPALRLRASLVAQARAQQARLVARGLVDPRTRRESLWLGDQPASMPA